MNLGKLSAGIIFVVFACGIILGFVLVEAGNGIKSNVSDSGGGIEIAVGFMIIGAGYLVIAGSVLWAASTSIIAAIAFLVRWVELNTAFETKQLLLQDNRLVTRTGMVARKNFKVLTTTSFKVILNLRVAAIGCGFNRSTQHIH
jgi:hypothetical protein